MSDLTDFRPQRKNANRHAARGMAALERSIQQDGWIGAITVAADGETFDGSARVETGASAGFDGIEPIVVRSRGDRPIIHIREDIPTADDPRARRLGVAANRVAELNLDWDVSALADVDLDGLFTRGELGELFAGAEIALTEPSPSRTSGDPAKQIKAVLYVDEIAIFERALRATGERNRGQALLVVCRAYLDSHAEA